MTGNAVRIAAWGAAGLLLLLLPLLAMQFTDEVNWTARDFAFMGLLLLGTGLSFEFVVRKTANPRYRVAAGLALLGMFLLVWINAAVGIIGPP